ncbi:MAG: metal ABC transporter substrate-binding protein [Lawsonella sp.]|nr:zinc ABC transporter solute-binding protein [Mycobacteriales bacterium]
MRIPKTLAALLAASSLVLTLGLTGCGESRRFAESATQADVKVVATTTQICDFVTQIATDDSPDAQLSFTKMDSAGKVTHAGADPDSAQTTLSLTCLLAPNASAHSHEMTPQQMVALGAADLFFVNGVGLENFLESAVDASGFKGTMGVTSGVLTAADVRDPASIPSRDAARLYQVYRGVEQVDVQEWPFKPTEPGEKAEFCFDPHVWMSPRNASIQVRNIGEALKQVSPTNAALFDKHVTSYHQKLQKLDAWVQKAIDSVPAQQRILFTSHDAFGYLARDYGVKFIGAALSDFNAQQDATADHIRNAAEEVRRSGAVALFAENSNNSKSIEAVARAAGVKAIIGEDALYGDSLGPAGSAGDTYLGSIVHNITTLVNTWGGTIPAQDW